MWRTVSRNRECCLKIGGRNWYVTPLRNKYIIAHKKKEYPASQTLPYLLFSSGVIKYMREIKFRAWNKEWKCMKPVAKLTFECDVQSLMVYNDATDGYGNVSIYEEWEDCIIGDDVILMQFTGLLDKNGVEIYEGDIIKDNEIKGCVKFGEIREYNSDSGGDDVFTGFYVYYKDLFTEGFDSKTAKRYEIIGNIYENPDLLPTQSQE